MDGVGVHAGHGDQNGLIARERAALRGGIKGRILGQDPFDRECIWHWMWVSNTPENLLSVVDMALWDLQARAFGVPVHKLLGGCRERVKAYASTNPNMGLPEVDMSGFANLQVLGATSEDVCEYYERGLLAPGVDEETPVPYLEAICDPLDADGYVTVPTEPGMGYRLIWDYVEENRIVE